MASLVLLAGCNRADPADGDAAPNAAGVTIKAQWGSGRDAMCLDKERAGLIVYAAEGDANCTARGTTESVTGGFRLRPDGDQACAIDVRMDQGAVILGELSPACAYYCGPKASYAGKRLAPMDLARPAVDLAGDPLC